MSLDGNKLRDLAVTVRLIKSAAYSEDAAELFDISDSRLLIRAAKALECVAFTLPKLAADSPRSHDRPAAFESMFRGGRVRD